MWHGTATKPVPESESAPGKPWKRAVAVATRAKSANVAVDRLDPLSRPLAAGCPASLSRPTPVLQALSEGFADHRTSQRA